jgi:hypothetical protein
MTNNTSLEVVLFDDDKERSQFYAVVEYTQVKPGVRTGRILHKEYCDVRCDIEGGAETRATNKMNAMIAGAL